MTTLPDPNPPRWLFPLLLFAELAALAALGYLISHL